MSALAFADIACARSGRILFEGLAFALGPGDAALVTGANGVGKSSLVRIAAGLLRPADGTVIREGTLALLGETHALDPELPLGRALAFWIARVDTALAAVGMAHLAQVPVRVLSTGQRRRAGLARVIGSGASIWLLDEPGNGLDGDGIVRLEAVIEEHRAGGGIVLVATHQPIALPGATMVTLN